MSAEQGAMRSPLSWYGGKGQMVQHIIPLLPPHECYVEPFFGGGSIFFGKPRAAIETINDVDDGVVGFYRVLRDPGQYAAFVRLAELTPYARVEYETCRRTWREESDPVRRAWAWFVCVRQAFGGGGIPAGTVGWKHGKTGGSRSSWGVRVRNVDQSAGRRWLTAVEGLPAVHERLQRVQIEHGDWHHILRAHDHEDVLAYLDPPYVLETRAGGKRYEHEMTLADHHALTSVLLAYRGLCVLSGYRHGAVHAPLEEAGWQRTDIDMAVSVARERTGLRRTESVWRNPAAVQAWQTAQWPLFAQSAAGSTTGAAR